MLYFAAFASMQAYRYDLPEVPFHFVQILTAYLLENRLAGEVRPCGLLLHFVHCTTASSAESMTLLGQFRDADSCVDTKDAT